jgi:ribosome-binding factor A
MSLETLRRYKKPSFRRLKIGKEIQSIVSTLLLHGEIKDKKLQKHDITITHVDCSEDLKHARVFFSCLGLNRPNLNVQQQLISGFNRANGYISNRVNKKLGLFRSPELEFKVDNTIYDAESVVDLLKTISPPA